MQKNNCDDEKNFPTGFMTKFINHLQIINQTKLTLCKYHLR